MAAVQSNYRSVHKNDIVALSLTITRTIISMYLIHFLVVQSAIATSWECQFHGSHRLNCYLRDTMLQPILRPLRWNSIRSRRHFLLPRHHWHTQFSRPKTPCTIHDGLNRSDLYKFRHCPNSRTSSHVPNCLDRECRWEQQLKRK